MTLPVSPPAPRCAGWGGLRLGLLAPLWLALHKPPGHVTTRRDPQGRPTVYGLIPEQYHGLFYVGRLDNDSEGLVLLTNDGEAANRLMHPRYGTEREYDAEVRGEVTPAELRRLRTGVELEDGPARAQEAQRMGGSSPGWTRVRLVLKEGRKREVRRMFAALGHRVERLVRVRYGPVKLGSLSPGAWRRLSANELLALSAVGREGAV